MSERDTPTILAAIEKFVEGPHDMLTTDPEHCSACREYHQAKLALRTLRSQIEKEREFVEAAMAFSAAVVRTFPASLKQRRADTLGGLEDIQHAAYRALSEKPPEEGAK